MALPLLLTNLESTIHRPAIQRTGFASYILYPPQE